MAESIIKIKTVESKKWSCPACGNMLIDRKLEIPESSSEAVFVEAQYCNHCRHYFVEKKQRIDEYLRDNGYASDYQIDGRFIWSYTRSGEGQRVKLLELEPHFPSAIEGIYIIFDDGRTEGYVIVYEKAEADGRRSVHYTSELGRELLSAVHVKIREKQGRINGARYRVINTAFCKKLAFELVPNTIRIRPEEGYYGTQREGAKLVSVLLFSPFTQRLETIKTTYIVSENRYYTDIHFYRSFVKQYGNPRVQLLFPTRNHEYYDEEEYGHEPHPF